MTLPKQDNATDTIAQAATADTQVAQRAIQGGIMQLTGIQRELDDFVNGRGTVPVWPNLVSRFRATLDQMRQAEHQFGWSDGGT